MAFPATHLKLSRLKWVAFKFKLKATPEVSQQLANFAGGSRFVWNNALALGHFREITSLDDHDL
ncbi:MAG: helix-turn-helix domain-containing protein [Methylobacter sp.]|nr:helix-turn-helix domain-containing protein [Methylobacter sp.]MDP2428784.1 helix-turn-helix domain-containing protein [Methylobacter sp.]MDP3056114.1 helix-turn-helix domain-containing protein [Methylobacter sp.]MDP3363899.1 helix-turn-helix domain-containing protein [Methylobacter sp.]MDZ4219373.1 helix-turn-helix domain-containing protein [Methylobacter sp.]